MDVHDLLVFLDGNSLALFLIYCLETLLNNNLWILGNEIINYLFTHSNGEKN